MNGPIRPSAGAARDRKLVLVTRRTRLQELVQRHNSLAQARFYVGHLGADFDDYEREDVTYRRSLEAVHRVLQDWGRYQVLERAFLPNYVFGDDDLVIALGQDGLVANTLKYLAGQPLIGINPDPARWDGRLLPFGVGDLAGVLRATAVGRSRLQAVTMAEARLPDGQVMRAVNDLFIGAQTHVSAQYDIAMGQAEEHQSSSGVIVSTGLGATGWMRSVLSGAQRIARLSANLPPTPDSGTADATGPNGSAAREHWGDTALQFAVREAFPSRTTQTGLVYGRITPDAPLRIRSRMAEDGVIFSDGMEADFLRFSAGMEARIAVSPQQGWLVV